MKTATKQDARPVESMTITVQWGRTGTVTANVETRFADGRMATSRHRAGGGGYCKASTVIAAAFNEFLSYRLRDADLAEKAAASQPFTLNGKRQGTPYGIRLGADGYFGGGIGVREYETISEFLGGRLEHITEGRAGGCPFAVYRYTATA